LVPSEKRFQLIRFASLKAVLDVVPIPRKRAAGMPAVTLVAHAATITAAVNLATSAAMTLPGDVCCILYQLHETR
jgi:hypothetical protein